MSDIPVTQHDAQNAEQWV